MAKKKKDETTTTDAAEAAESLPTQAYEPTNERLLAKARDLYAVFAASSDDALPNWDDLMKSEILQWYSVALRAHQLELSISANSREGSLGNEQTTPPALHVFPHFADPSTAFESWKVHANKA